MSGADFGTIGCVGPADQCSCGLVDLCAAGAATAAVDVADVRAALLAAHTGRVLSVNQAVPLQVRGADGGALVSVLLRVAETQTLGREERRAALGYHAFRGRLRPDTTVAIVASDALGAGALGFSRCEPNLNVAKNVDGVGRREGETGAVQFSS